MWSVALFPQDAEYFVSAQHGVSSCAWQYPTHMSSLLLILRIFPWHFWLVGWFVFVCLFGFYLGFGFLWVFGWLGFFFFQLWYAGWHTWNAINRFLSITPSCNLLYWGSVMNLLSECFPEYSQHKCVFLYINQPSHIWIFWPPESGFYLLEAK